jgi:uncharacterized protein (TIGR03083 family)
MTSVTPQLEVLTRYQGEFLDTIGRADPAAPVPWCGRWRVSNLVVHLARVHHWAAAQARRRQEAPLGRGPFDLAELYRDCAAELRTTLTELDPDARAWTLLDDGVPRAEQRGTVAFWHRRQTLETLVHLWDLRAAIGEDVDAAPAPGPGSWVDCIDEVATVMHPRQIRLGRVEAPSVRLRLEVSDGVGSWELEAAPGTTEIVTLTGAARELALLIWGRAELDGPGLSVTGDRESAARVLALGLTP